MDMAQQLRDLALREADTMPPGWKDAYWLYRAAAERIEADAKRIAELERMLAVCEECGLAIEEDAVEQRDRADAAEARVKELEAEGFSLAAWQCVLTDGSGLTGDEHGNQYCRMIRRADAADARVKELEAALLFLKANYDVGDVVDAALEGEK